VSSEPGPQPEAPDRFRSAFETAGHGMAIVALDGRFIEVNRALCDLLGYSETELLESNFQTVTHPEDLEADIGLVAQLLGGAGRSYEMEKRYLHKDGRTINARLSVGLIRDEDGGPRYFVSQIYDITVQKQQAEVLHGYQARLELALETARAAYWELDLGSQTYSSGAEYFALLGYERDQATEDKQSWLALVHPEDRTSIAEAHRLLPHDGGSHQIEYRIRARGGGWRWLKSHLRASAFDNLGRPSHLLGIDIDITEEKSRQAELLAARAQVAQAARRARIAFWHQEFGFGSMVWSGAAAEILGQADGRLPASTEDYLKLIHRDDIDRVRAAYAQARAQSTAYELQYRLIRADNSIAWLNEIGQIVPGHGNEAPSFTGTVQDITERKQLELRLEQLATVDDLTGAQNRRAFTTQSQIELRRALRFKHALSFLFLDIDHFKQVNDQYGHNFGDQVLATFSTICQSKLRPSDVFARYGGEEFVLMLPETDIAQAGVVAGRLRAALRETKFGDNPVMHGIGVSIGMTSLRGPQDTLSAILERVDRALYRAKSGGRDRVEVEP
jgi:diguanylate cyclase (GGDEF)-like protein/PAS domain S-box-containing protein